MLFYFYHRYKDYFNVKEHVHNLLKRSIENNTVTTSLPYLISKESRCKVTGMVNIVFATFIELT